MNIIQQIKEVIGRKIVDGLINLKPFKMPKLQTIETIGILYNATDEQNEKNVQQIASELKNSGKKVYILGFINNKKPLKQKHIHEYNEYFWHEHLNFFNVPDFARIGKFVTQPFDLLINLYHEDLLPLQAISAKSNAVFKIGIKTDLSLKYNHALIDCGKKQNVLNASKQINHYLNTVSNG